MNQLGGTTESQDHRGGFQLILRNELRPRQVIESCKAGKECCSVFRTTFVFHCVSCASHSYSDLSLLYSVALSCPRLFFLVVLSLLHGLWFFFDFTLSLEICLVPSHLSLDFSNVFNYDSLV